MKHEKGDTLYEEQYSRNERLFFYVGSLIFILTIIFTSILIWHRILINPPYEDDQFKTIIFNTMLVAGWVVMEFTCMLFFIGLYQLFQPIQIDDNGILISVMFHNNKFLDRVEIRKNDVSKIYGQYFDVFDRASGKYSGFAIITNDGNVFKTGKRFRAHIDEILAEFQKNFPKSIIDT